VQFAPLEAWGAFLRDLPGMIVSAQYDAAPEEIAALEAMSGRKIIVPQDARPENRTRPQLRDAFGARCRRDCADCRLVACLRGRSADVQNSVRHKLDELRREMRALRTVLCLRHAAQTWRLARYLCASVRRYPFAASGELTRRAFRAAARSAATLEWLHPHRSL
jgi:hypothetical protein